MVGRGVGDREGGEVAAAASSPPSLSRIEITSKAHLKKLVVKVRRAVRQPGMKAAPGPPCAICMCMRCVAVVRATHPSARSHPEGDTRGACEVLLLLAFKPRVVFCNHSLGCTCCVRIWCQRRYYLARGLLGVGCADGRGVTGSSGQRLYRCQCHRGLCFLLVTRMVDGVKIVDF